MGKIIKPELLNIDNSEFAKYVEKRKKKLANYSTTILSNLKVIKLLEEQSKIWDCFQEL